MKKKNMFDVKAENRKGFTLMELLVVVALMAILSVAVYLGISRSAGNTMNEKVESDLLAIQNALEQFKEDNGHYPALNELSLGGNKNVLCFDEKMAYLHTCEKATFLQTQIDNNLLTKRYLQEVPTDPHTQSRYSYGVTTDGQYYQIAGIQEQKNNAWTAKLIGNLDDNSSLPGLLRAYDAGNFVSEGGSFLPYSPHPKKITARLNGVKGTVMVNGGPAIEGQVVEPGDTIKTEAESTVILYFSDGSITYLDENSQLRLLPTSEVSENSKDDIVTKIRLKLFQGNAWNKVVRLADQSEFNIETTTAIAGVRGTEFGISADKDELTVYTGVVASRLKTVDEKASSNGEGQSLPFSVEESFVPSQDAESDGAEMKRFSIPAQNKAIGPGVALSVDQMSVILEKYYLSQKLSLSEADKPYLVKAQSHADGSYTIYVAFNGFASDNNYQPDGFDVYGMSQTNGIRMLEPGVKPLLTIKTVIYEAKEKAYAFELPTYSKNPADPLYNQEKKDMESIVLQAYQNTKQGNRVLSGLSWPGVGLVPDEKQEFTYRFDNLPLYPGTEKTPELAGTVKIFPLAQTVYALNEGPIELKANKACDWTLGGNNQNSGIFKEGGKNTAITQYYPLDSNMTAAEKMANVMGRFDGKSEETVDIKCTNPKDPNDADSTSLTITYAPKTMSGESGYWYSYTAQSNIDWPTASQECGNLNEGGKDDWTLPNKIAYEGINISEEKSNLCDFDGDICTDLINVNNFFFQEKDTDNGYIISMKVEIFGPIPKKLPAQNSNGFRCVRVN